MAAQPARWLGEVNRATGQIEVRDVDSDRYPTGSAYWVTIGELSNAESFKVCGALGLNPKNYSTLTDRIEAIRHAVSNDRPWNPVNAHGGAERPTDTPNNATDTDTDKATVRVRVEAEESEEVPEVKVPEVKVPDTQPTDETADVGKAIADAVSKAIGGLLANAGMSEDAVRKLIAEETAHLKPTIIEVSMNDLPTITIESLEHEVFPTVLRLIGIRRHVWLVGPAGTGKSTIAHHAANALDMPFYSISCHAQMTASQVFGYMNAQGEYVPSLFRQAYENGGVFLFDEIDAGSSNVLAAVNQALSNGHCAFPDAMVPKHEGFVCIAAANTYGKGANAEYSGRAKIDEATIDRFWQVQVDYDRNLEDTLVRQYLTDTSAADSWINRFEGYRANAESHGLKVILGLRGKVEGAMGLAAGFTEREVIAMRVLRGVGEDVRRKVEGR